MQPTLAQMKMALGKIPSKIDLQNIGVNEAPDMTPKGYVPPESPQGNFLPPGGSATPSGMPIGGIDMNAAQPGQQLMPGNALQPAPNAQAGQPASSPMGAPAGQPPGPGGAPAQPPGGSNILNMTPQGRAMNAIGPAQPMADGGQPKVEHEYDDKHPTMMGLARAFDEAIAHHLSLSEDDRKINSLLAEERVGDIIGRANSGPRKGRSKDLLGKNAKLLKSEKGKGKAEPMKLPDGRGVETTGLALSPAYREGNFDTCPNHHSCKAECLGKTSGNYFKLGGGQNLDEFQGPRLNSLLKTQAFLRDPHAFAVKLHDEIESAKAEAGKNGNHLGLRLNVLSDINPRVHKSIIEAHPDVTFYDYTKNNTDPIAPNHHYTYSSTGVSQPGVENQHTNWKQMRRRLDQGSNVAMAFTHKTHLPSHVHDEETGKKYRVIDGDTHDFRPDDMVPDGEDGVIVGLRNKKASGKMDRAHIDSNGFFVHYDPQEKKVPNKSGKAMIYARDQDGQTIPANREARIKPQRWAIKLQSNDGESA